MTPRGRSRSRPAKIRRDIADFLKGLLLLTVVIASLLLMVWLSGVTTYAATSSTQSEAVQAEELNPYRSIILYMTEEERTELEAILYLEAGIDTFDGRLATLQVIMNRIIDPRFPSDIHSVLSQPHQYSTWKKRNKATPGEQESDAIAYMANATDINDFPIGFDRVYQDCRPIGKEPVKIGKQYFGK